MLGNRRDTNVCDPGVILPQTGNTADAVAMTTNFDHVDSAALTSSSSPLALFDPALYYGKDG